MTPRAESGPRAYGRVESGRGTDLPKWGQKEFRLSCGSVFVATPQRTSKSGLRNGVPNLNDRLWEKPVAQAAANKRIESAFFGAPDFIG